MSRRNGYVLLGLVLALSLFALSGSVAVFEQDTRLKRFKEGELKTNLDTIRRAIDLYRFKYSVTAPDPGKLSLLDSIFATGMATPVIRLLTDESFLRARLATGTMRWRRSMNLVQNPSFELDTGTTDPLLYTAGSWRGNFTANDLVPDGWELTSAGAFQKIVLPVAGTFVVSFWARCASPTASVRMKFGPDPVSPALQLNANRSEWSRYYGVYTTSTAGEIVHLEYELNGSSGATAYVDGVMVEPWTPPAGAPPSLKPVPSAWVAKFSIVSDLASETLQQQIFSDLIPPDATPASLSWWLQW